LFGSRGRLEPGAVALAALFVALGAHVRQADQEPPLTYP
jgi:hypothetical protein